MQSIALSFENNVGHDDGVNPPRFAKILDPNDAVTPWKTSRNVMTNNQGEVTTTVLSSDVISQPRLVARWQNAIVGSLVCDFAAAISRRGIPDPADPADPDWQANDTGWSVETGNIEKPGDVCNGRITMQFQSANGTFQKVEGHSLRIRIAKINLSDGSEIYDLNEIGRYLKFWTANQESNTFTGTTDANGVLNFSLKGMDEVDGVRGIEFYSQDITHWDSVKEFYHEQKNHSLVHLSLLMPAIVWADGPLPQPQPGSGVFGANRRVITLPDGYNGIRGSFTVPTFRIPTSFYAPPVPAAYVLDGNSAISKPGFYLGCRQDPTDSDPDDPDNTLKLDVDAGVIWEPRPFFLDGGKKIAPGFSIFVFTKGFYTPKAGIHVNPANQWRASVGTAGGENANVTQFDLTWLIYRRRSGSFNLPGYGGYLQVNAIGANVQPSDGFGELGRIYARGAGDTELICDSTNVMSVKRVVAMNQGGSYNAGPGSNSPTRSSYLPTNGIYEEDGSYMRDCVFGGITGQPNGQVLKQTALGAYANPTAWLSLSSPGFVNSANTGYYPPGFDQTVDIPLRPLATARKHFEFPEIPVAEWDIAGDNSRYGNETVNINLRNARTVVGDLVIPGGGGTWSTGE